MRHGMPPALYLLSMNAQCFEAPSVATVAAPKSAAVCEATWRVHHSTTTPFLMLPKEHSSSETRGSKQWWRWGTHTVPKGVLCFLLGWKGSAVLYLSSFADGFAGAVIGFDTARFAAASYA